MKSFSKLKCLFFFKAIYNFCTGRATVDELVDFEESSEVPK